MNKPLLKLYHFDGNSFVRFAIVDDYAECSFENNYYDAGQFSISINFNIPNASNFRVGDLVQFGNDRNKVGEIKYISDAIGPEGKGSQIRTITGYDLRYIFKRRVIKNLNTAEAWVMNSDGESVMRQLIIDQTNETKRQLPIVLPQTNAHLGQTVSVAESYTNLYEVLSTVATQARLGWTVTLEEGLLYVKFFLGQDLHSTVIFSTEMESLAEGNYTQDVNNYTNAVYVGGKGQGADRDIYLGETEEAEGFSRFESWVNQSVMNTTSEYNDEARNILSQYGQIVSVDGNALIKSTYEFGKDYNIGDDVSIEINDIRNPTKILSVTEHWIWGNYNLDFTFGTPKNDLADQLQIMLRQIQKASNKTNSTDSVRWYTIPTDYEMPSGDVVYNTIGFIGNDGEGSTFKLYLDDEKTGSKTYHVYIKQLAGSTLTLTTGVSGKENVVLPAGTYVAIIYVDSEGNISLNSATPTNTIASGSTLPATSGAVYNAISNSGVPTGSVIPYYGTIDPQGWFICDGRDTSGTSYELAIYYPSLYALLGGNVLPDLRGEFIRGAGTNSHANQGDGASVGVHQDATVLLPQVEFGHDIHVWNNDSTKLTINQNAYEYPNNCNYTKTAYMFRPTNTSLNYIIKA